jgi:hypothetical protein
LTEGQIDKTIKTLEAMIDEASAKREVILAMVMRRCRLKVCDRVVADALHARGYWFHKLRTKMILTPDDVKDRFAWSKKYKGKNRHWWQKRIQVHLDNHHFKHATTSKGRALLAKRLVRGAYRTKTKSLRPGHVKPDPKMRLATGSKGILKMGGVRAYVRTYVRTYAAYAVLVVPFTAARRTPGLYCFCVAKGRH